MKTTSESVEHLKAGKRIIVKRKGDDESEDMETLQVQVHHAS